MSPSAPPTGGARDYFYYDPEYDKRKQPKFSLRKLMDEMLHRFRLRPSLSLSASASQPAPEVARVIDRLARIRADDDEILAILGATYE